MVQKYMTEMEQRVAAIERLHNSKRAFLTDLNAKCAKDIILLAMISEVETIEEFSELPDPEAVAFDRLQPGLQDAVFWVCVMGLGIEELEREMDWPARTGRIMLKYGLEAYEELL